MAVAWTEDQQKVLNHRYGNLLVSAAAGSGKTAVLIERLVQILTDPQDPVSVDELLIVTFTAQAAAQMRDKLYQRLNEIFETTGELRIQRQLQMLPAASIMTIHAFCLQCIRSYITRIEGLDPGFRIADATEAVLMQADALEEVLERCYGWALENPEDADAMNYAALVDCYSGARQDQRLEELIENTDHFLGGIVDAEGWLASAAQAYCVNSEEQLCKTPWYEVMKSRQRILFDKARELYRQLLQEYIAAGADEKHKTAAALRTVFLNLQHIDVVWPELGDVTISRMDYGLWKEDPEGKKQVQKLANEAKEAVKEALELETQWMAPGSSKMMREKIYPSLKGLEWVYAQYRRQYQMAKQDKNIVDFQDLERYALKILRRDGGEPTTEAIELQEQYRYICIDEYQDSNDVQEAVLTAIARVDAEGNPVNIFMVGDVKQSIYKFRQARPELFLEKQERYEDQQGASRIFLHQNFRSRAHILEGINDVFRALMYKPDGEIDYTDEEALVPGRQYPECEYPLVTALPCCTILTSPTSLTSATAIEAEAEYIAKKIQMMVMEGHQVWDDTEKGYRPVRYRDIVILLRSMQTVAPVYQEALRRYVVPSYSEITGGFYQTKEIQCILNMLRIIDNPLQDIPLMGVLYAPVFGYTGHELAQLRLTGGRNTDLYHSLLEYAQIGPDPSLKGKVQSFLEMLGEWREWAVYYSIHDLIWRLYQTTGYYRYVAAGVDGEYRKANLDLLLIRAQEYEKGSYSGLFHFLRYIEKMERQSRDDVDAKMLGEEDDVVRIMSIHKSKGLEFPVVFIGGAGRGFNMMDLREAVLFHPELGIGTEAIDAEAGFRYETLPHKALMEKKRQEAYAEEMRVLYVALTRASEYLEVVGYRKKDAVEILMEDGKLPGYGVQGASNYLEWLEPIVRGSSMWRVQEVTAQLPQETEETEIEEAAGIMGADEKLYRKLDLHMQWQYPYSWKRHLPARLSVSRIKEAKEEEAIQFVVSEADTDGNEKMPSGAHVGTALHAALAKIDLGITNSEEEIINQLDQMLESGYLTEEERQLISVDQLLMWLRSDLVQRMRRSSVLLREQPFIAAFTIEELRELVPGWMETLEISDIRERVMVQGIVDCCFMEEDQWVLVDYKSDKYISQTRLEEYRLQLRLYEKALSGITGTPVKETILYLTRRGTVL